MGLHVCILHKWTIWGENSRSVCTPKFLRDNECVYLLGEAEHGPNAPYSVGYTGYTHNKGEFSMLRVGGME